MQTFRKITERKSDGLVIHVSSLNDRSTEVVMRERITIGASDECDVKIRLPQTTAPANGPVIELARLNGVYRIANFELVREINPSTKIIAFAILIAALVGGLYIGFGVFNELRRTRRANAELAAGMAAEKAEVERTNQQLSQLDESNKNVIRSLSLAVK